MSDQPKMTRPEIRKKRDELKAKQTKQLHELAKQKMDKIEKLSEKYHINMDMMRSPEALAKEIVNLEEAINEGNRSSIAIKKKVIEAKSELEKELNNFDKRKKKILKDIKAEREKINVEDKKWFDIRVQEREREYEKTRATAQEVDVLLSKVRSLEQRMKKYKLDRHLVAQMENLKAENEMIKGQLQKIFQILKNAGLGR